MFHSTGRAQAVPIAYREVRVTPGAAAPGPRSIPLPIINITTEKPGARGEGGWAGPRAGGAALADGEQHRLFGKALPASSVCPRPVCARIRPPVGSQPAMPRPRDLSACSRATTGRLTGPAPALPAVGAMAFTSLRTNMTCTPTSFPGGANQARAWLRYAVAAAAVVAAVAAQTGVAARRRRAAALDGADDLAGSLGNRLSLGSGGSGALFETQKGGAARDSLWRSKCVGSALGRAEPHGSIAGARPAACAGRAALQDKSGCSEHQPPSARAAWLAGPSLPCRAPWPALAAPASLQGGSHRGPADWRHPGQGRLRSGVHRWAA